MGHLRAPSENQVGPYLLGDRLGSGGMAEVYIARGASGALAGHRCAIKRILPQLAKDPRFVAMFCDEGRICAALDHPNIVKVLDFGEHGGELLMAMEYVEGTSCARLLRAVAARGRRFPVDVALTIAQEVLQGLAYAHEATDERGRSLGLVHRDVSPGNILISKVGEVKLSDFGIVRSEFITRRTYPGELKGKIGYMSPEQVMSADVDPRSDLFALGIVLAEMLLTRPLFPGRSEMDILTRIYEADLRVLDEHATDLPSGLYDILRWTLRRRASERPSSARVLSCALSEFAKDLKIELGTDRLVQWLVSSDLLPSSSGVREVAPVRIAKPAPVRPSERDSLTPRSTVPVRSSPKTSYQVSLPNGDVLGPLDAAELVESFATRRLSLDAVVSRNGGRGRTAHSLRELSAVVQVERWMDAVLGSAGACRVNIERARLPAFLFALVQRRQTGVLILTDGSRRLAITWKEGAPCAAVSSDRDLLLGSQLVKEGLITAEMLGEAFEVLVSGEAGSDQREGRLGDLLIERRWVAPADLLRVLVRQLEARIVEIGKWRSGELCFVAGDEHVRGGLQTTTSATGLIATAVRRGFGAEELEDILNGLGENPVAYNPAAALSASTLGLQSAELEALTRAAGARSVSAYLDSAATARGMSAADARRGVFLGLSAGILVCPAWSLH